MSSTKEMVDFLFSLNKFIKAQELMSYDELNITHDLYCEEIDRDEERRMYEQLPNTSEEYDFYVDIIPSLIKTREKLNEQQKEVADLFYGCHINLREALNAVGEINNEND
jgi:hypothetical protein